MKIGIITMGTGKYDRYLKNNLTSFYKYFFPSYERKFVFLTNNEILSPPITSNILHFPKYPWPKSTLFKPKAINKCKSILSECDIVYWVDVDLNCIDEIKIETDVFPTISTPICVMKHCGWLNENKEEVVYYPYETRPESLAYVKDIYNVPYHQACLFGGYYKNFFEMCEVLEKNIDIDLEKNIIAIYHDESHLNRYLQNHAFKSIPKIYGRPVAMGDLLPNTKIISIIKNESEVRS